MKKRLIYGIGIHCILTKPDPLSGFKHAAF